MTNGLAALAPRALLIMLAATAGFQMRAYAQPVASTACPDGAVACELRSGFAGREGSLAVNSKGSVFLAGLMPKRSAEGEPLEPAGLARLRAGAEQWDKVDLPRGTDAIIAYVYVDKDTDRLFYTSSTFGSCGLPLGFSDDEGATWHLTKTGCWPLTLGDWGRIFTGKPVSSRTDGYPNMVYYCNYLPFPTLGPGVGCWKSKDGGKHFEYTSSPHNFITGCRSRSFTIAGAGVVDPKGVIYLPINACGDMKLAISRDEGATWTQAFVPGARTGNWASQQKDKGQRKCDDEPWSCPTFAQGFISDVLSVDTAGNLYLIWSEDSLRLSVSRNGGKTWSRNRVVSPPDVKLTQLVSIAANAPGEVALAYYGKSNSPGWHGYMARSVNALDAEPAFVTAPISKPDDPLNPGTCCGHRGYKERGPWLIEYSGVKFAPDGSVWGAFFRDHPQDRIFEMVAGKMSAPNTATSATTAAMQ
ncbi:MAG: sialidase family protein [Steroidobacteraceae bacterium]